MVFPFKPQWQSDAEKHGELCEPLCLPALGGSTQKTSVLIECALDLTSAAFPFTHK
jgi:hypothetical protein